MIWSCSHTTSRATWSQAPFTCRSKAGETLEAVGTDYVFDLDIRDYNLWMLEEMPVILILFAASQRRAYWLWIQKYFSKDAARQPKKGAKTVRVRVPQRRPVTGKAIAAWRTQAASTATSEKRGVVTTTELTYGQLDRVLRSLGFSSRLVQGKPPARHYEHKKTGAFITLPPLPEQRHVFEHHLVTVRETLEVSASPIQRPSLRESTRQDEFAGRIVTARRLEPRGPSVVESQGLHYEGITDVVADHCWDTGPLYSNDVALR